MKANLANKKTAKAVPTRKRSVPKKKGQNAILRGEFRQSMADTICEHISSGKSLRWVCAQEGICSMPTVLKWLSQNKDFATQYARAREAQADRIFDEILEIADESSRDVVVGEDGRETVNHEVVARAKLRVDARKWMAGKLRPKVYGEKLEIEATVTPNKLSDDELNARILAATGQLAKAAAGRTA